MPALLSDSLVGSCDFHYGTHSLVHTSADFTRQSSYPSLELGESSNPSALGSTLSSSSGLSQSTSNLPAVGRITRLTARQNSVPVINVEEYPDSRSRRRRH